MVETENEKDMIVRKENKMKKALAILLVLLVAGVAFGAGADTLTLKSTVTAKTSHGFGANLLANNTFGGIIAAGSGLGNNSYDTLDLESNTDQPVGYYYFATSSSAAKVEFVLKPMTTTTELGSDTYYVPYSLKYSKKAGSVPAGGTGEITSTSGASLVALSTTPIVDTDPVIIVDSDISQSKWISLSLSIAFAGTANATAGIPAATYVGSVVATVVAP